MNIVLFKFNKKPNSDKRPPAGTTSVTLGCQVKTASSVMTPMVEVAKSTEPIGYNYAYIASFGRYYFINDITYTIGGWLLSLECDVLATYRPDIIASDQYVIRSALQFDTNIVDTYYPTTTKVLETYATTGTVVKYGSTSLSNYWDRTISDGFFVLGVIGNNAGGVSYYVYSYTAFKNLVNELFSFTPSDMSDVSAGIAKQLADPMQYLTTCLWYPYVPIDGTQTSQLKFGNYTIPAYGYTLPESSFVSNNFSFTQTLPKHPQNTRGAYLNSAPFSSYMLDFQPFGSIALDATRLVNVAKLGLKWKVDFTTGESVLKLYDPDVVGSCLGIYHASYGIPIRLTQTTVDMLSAGSSALGAVGSLLQLDLGGIFNNIAGATNAMQPQVSTSGFTGSFLQHTAPDIYCTFFYVAYEDRDNIGRPLCKITALSELTGYVQTANAHIEIETATELEKQRIMELMDSGFYRE